MIDHANDVDLNIRNTTLRGVDYQKLTQQVHELESIVQSITYLDVYVNDETKSNEAIDLLEFITQLHKKYGHQVPLIEAIYKQSEKQREYLISNLCDRLEHLDSSQGGAISTFNQLARCGDFSDRDLRLKYLQARDNWFNNTCEAQGASFDNVVSVHCSGLPMIFNEYKSIFNDAIEKTERKLMKVPSLDRIKEDGAIINSWLLLKTSIFIASLDVYLKTINQSGTQTPTMIGDTMQKCFQLTDWLASIGFDFSSQLRPLFSRALIEEVKLSIEKATAKFESAFAITFSKSIETLLLPVDDEILRISNMRPEEQIPKSMEHYPIFQIYCLYILDSLRWLQTTKDTFSPIGLCLDTYAALNSSLTRIMKALALLLNMDNNSNHPILSKIAISFTTEFLPFIANYCDRLFPEKVILATLGLSKTEFKSLYLNEPDKLKNFKLDMRQIADPLKSTMPALLQTLET